jgi:NADPH-dependent curcumin reductase CurA
MEYLGEMGQLFGLAFEVLIPLVRKNKIKTQKTSLDGLQPMPAPIAKILAPDLRV